MPARGKKFLCCIASYPNGDRRRQERLLPKRTGFNPTGLLAGFRHRWLYLFIRGPRKGLILEEGSERGRRLEEFVSAPRPHACVCRWRAATAGRGVGGSERGKSRANLASLSCCSPPTSRPRLGSLGAETRGRQGRARSGQKKRSQPSCFGSKTCALRSALSPRSVMPSM